MSGLLCTTHDCTHGYETACHEQCPPKIGNGVQAPDGAQLPPVQATPPAACTPLPRRFILVRDVDVSEVSGTGVVVEGVEWSDGTVSIRWRGDHPSFAEWPDVNEVMAVHGHSGATRLVWLDLEAPIDYWPVEGVPV